MRRGGGAEVRLLGFDARRCRPLPARVAFVSPDRVSAPDDGRDAWFDATVEVDAAALRGRADVRAAAGHAGRAVRHDGRPHPASSTSPSRWTCSRAARCASPDPAPTATCLLLLRP